MQNKNVSSIEETYQKKLTLQKVLSKTPKCFVLHYTQNRETKICWKRNLVCKHKMREKFLKLIALKLKDCKIPIAPENFHIYHFTWRTEISTQHTLQLFKL